MMRNKETGLWNHSEDKTLGTYGGAYRSFEIQINGHTVLNGCLVITDTAVYELRPRFVNPLLLILNINCKMDLLLILLFSFDKKKILNEIWSLIFYFLKFESWEILDELILGWNIKNKKHFKFFIQNKWVLIKFN